MRYIIFSLKENAYWNNDEGWTTTNPTIFSEGERNTLNLPIGDGRWLPYTGLVCNRCCNLVVEEYDNSIDYPYYCPNCDENMYSFEVEDK